jgi:Ca2+-binding RTX toxin-like protein
MSVRSVLRPFIVLITALATLVAYAAVSVPPRPAQAADPETDGLRGLVTNLQTFVPGLAAVGRFGQPLPTLSVAPGSAAGIGLGTLLGQAVSSVLGSDYANAANVDALVSAINGKSGAITDGRTVSFTASKSTAGTVDTVTFGLHAIRKVSSTSLDITDNEPLAPGYPPFSLASEGGVQLDLTLDASFALNYDSSGGGASWITHSSNSPSLTLDSIGSIPTLDAVQAGLGILGVTLGDGTSFNLTVHLATAWADPNNDGRLAFNEPGGTNDDGELSAAGAAAGLVNPRLASGSLDSTLVIVDRDSPVIDLPDLANVTVQVKAPDLTVGNPEVTFDPGAFDPVKGFLTLSPRDLAQGLAQATATVLGLQDATGVKLPFMRGDLSDAIPAVQGIQEFLEKHVPEPTVDSDQPGLPSFPALQDMLEQLVDEASLPSGADLSIPVAAYNPANHKVNFTLQIDRAAGSAEALDPAAAPLTGTANYTDTTLVGTSKNFSAALIGRQVFAGTSSGVIKTVSGNTLTLDAGPVDDGDPNTPAPTVFWKGGKPANGTTYSIAADDPKTGLVELGNVLAASGGIKSGNAVAAQATVTPSYRLTLPIVLDLRDPNVSDCNPDPNATGACPYQDSDPISGISRIIYSLPQAADRIMIRTGNTLLLTADSPISTDVHINTTVGFVGVKIEGSLDECTTSTPADCTGTPATNDHLLSLSLKPVAGADVDGDVPLPSYVDKLRVAVAAGTPTNLFGFTVKGQAYASLIVSVPGAGAFFGGTPSATVTVTLPDITNPGGAQVTAPDLGKLASLDVDPNNPMALFGAVLAALQALNGAVSNIGDPAPLDTKIPLLGKSLSQIIGGGTSGSGSGVSYASGAGGTTVLTDNRQSFNISFIGRKITIGTTQHTVTEGIGHTLTFKPAASPLPAAGTAYSVQGELQGLLNILNDQPTSTLQDLLTQLAKSLGGGSVATFSVESGSPNVLKLVIDWKRSYINQSPFNMSFDLGGSKSIVGATGSGLLNISASGQVKITLRMPLSLAAVQNPLANLTVDPSGSFINAGVSLNGDGAKFDVNLGPFKASLGAPTGDPGTQLRAGLGVHLGSSGSTPVNLSTFISGLDITVNGDGDGNGSNDTTSCANAPAGGSTPLSVCAYFPAYINGAPVNADPTKNAFVVRLPVGSDLADTFNLGGLPIDGQPRLALPDGLADAFANAALNLFSFGDGIFGYLEFLENAMRTASFDGKLPVIGKDLQAGADFVGEMRTSLQGVFGNSPPTNPTAADIRNFLNGEFKSALPGAQHLTVDVTCNVTLDPASAPGVIATNGGDLSASYQYKIVAYVNTPAEDTTPSEPSAPVQNAVTLDPTHHNNLSWAPVSHAAGYKVLRSVDGGPFLLMKDVGNLLQYPDDGTDTPSGYTASTEEPLIVPCPGDASAGQITGFTVAVDIGQGTPSSNKGCEPNSGCIGDTMPLDLGIPGLSIKATDDTGGVKVALGWKLHLKFGFNRDDGFVIYTQDDPTPDKPADPNEKAVPEFVVGASLDVPDTTARLAFINVNEASNKPATPEFVGAFSIDLRNVAGFDCVPDCVIDNDKKITFSDLQGGSLTDFVNPVLNATVDIDWKLKADLSSSALPGVGANFKMHWGWASDASPSDSSGLDVLQFDNVTIDPGKFLGESVGRVVKQIVDLFKPVQPILDTIQAPLPVLSDLSRAVGGDDVTIASLAAAFSTIAGGPDLQPFLDVLQNIRDLLRLLAAECPNSETFCVNVGSFKMVKGKALTTDANPATADTLIDQANGFIKNNNLLGDLADRITAPGGGDLLKSSGGGTGSTGEHPGLTFPALDLVKNPTALFGLLLGKDVELAAFDSGPLTLGFEFQRSFGPVYAPPPVNIVIGGGASVTLRVKAGFDTFGIRTAIEAGKVDAKILDSLYFVTRNDAGKPIPVVHFEGFIQAGASVSVVIIEVGVVGGIKLTVDFTWNDPNNDGKFRFSEFLAAALTNPICLFNVGGELSLFIKVFITLGIDPFSVSFDFTLVNIKLLDFSLKPDCTPPPPKLGGTASDTLYLFAGKFGGTAQRAPGYSGAYPFDAANKADETWIIRQVTAKPDPDGTGPKLAQDAKVVVQALGITEEFNDKDGKIKNVVLDGRSYEGSLQVMFNGGEKDHPFDKDVVVATGTGKDVIRTGEGKSYVDGGPGADQVATFDRQDLSKALPQPAAVVAGGFGADTVTVGNAVDTVLGDNHLTFSNQASVPTKAADGTDVTLSNVINPTTVTLPASDHLADEVTGGDGDLTSDGGDTISAGLGGSTIYGNAGADIIGTANDSTLADLPANAGNQAQYRAHANLIVGGSGSDRIKSGSANDDIYTGAKDAINSDGFGSGDAAADENTVDTGAGSDKVYGSNAKDFVTTHSTQAQTATAFGGDSDDVLIGGAGPDKLYGGPANDYLVAEPATVSSDFPVTDVLSVATGPARSVTPLPLSTPSSAKTLVGGGGKDRIYGADGPAAIFGDHEVDTCVRQSDPVSKEPPENPTTDGPASGWDDDDLILGGDGVDTVQAGGGNDHAYLYGANDVACGNAGIDETFGGAQDDLVYGGSGPDKLYGEANDTEDELYGNTGDDAAYGGTGHDRIEGNNGFDRLFGGPDVDLVIGGTSQAGEPDIGDLLYGDTGTDNLLGDNAFVGGGGVGTPVDLAITSATPTQGGEDTVFGGDQDDVGYGGLRNDAMYGGGGADYMEGNNAVDTMFGQAGPDNLIGGSSQEPSAGVGRPDAGDIISGGDQDDVVTGDNAQVANVTAGTGSDLTKGRGLTSERSITLLDLGLGAATGLFGADTITGGNEPDVVLGQRGTDRIFGDGASDYAEGGQDADWIEGGTGSDDLVGGSSTILAGSGSGDAAQGQLDAGDVIFGQDGDDVQTGDNAVVTRVTPFNDLTYRIGSTGQITERRALRLLDQSNGPGAGSLLTPPAANRFGADFLSGQSGVDVLLGQDGADKISGGSADDYAEGQGADDTIYGDRSLAAAGIGLPVVAWPGSPSAGYDADTGADGQDDLIGGSSRPGFRDANDIVHGDGVSDFILGDGGTAVRDVLTDPGDGHLFDRIYTVRYPATLPAGAAKIRHSAAQYPSTRFCTTAQAKCEPTGASGGDTLYGEAGDDFIYGQDGDDTAFGGTGDDDIYGELDDVKGDTLYGEAGEDAMLGDRGGVRDVYENGSASETTVINQVPALTYTSRIAGSVSRVADLLHDVQGDAFVGSGAGSPMPYNGIAFGGNDRLRGGTGHDNLHAGVGDDLANGDSGGDTVFGDDGADLVWGGKGCDQAVDTAAVSPDCYSGGVFDPAARGTNDRFVDYIFGGKGATSGPSVGPGGDLGADVMDWRPRGTYVPGTGCTTNPWPVTGSGRNATTIDPCSWFEMTDISDADVTNNQHHQGIDWQYGGWDRDVLQADVADNGPNPGDRLLDWSGAYNLYTHCNAAYGGYNDVRQFSPDMQTFLQKWAYGVGAGQTLNDVLTGGTSAFIELALVYPADNIAHGTGSAFPSTPGHFDDPNACAL